MNHLTEEQLVLYYYGEPDLAEDLDSAAADGHLSACSACRETYASLQRVLNTLDAVPAPEPSADYGADVWRNIERRLPFARNWLPASGWRWAVAAVAMAGLLIAAFLAGRFYPSPTHRSAPLAAADPQVSERVLLVAVGDYLERSQMVLVELANANPKGELDISAEQERAAGLVSESRLYRQTAAHIGDTALSSVLDDLDRVLLDISHAPSELPAQDLEKLRARLAAEGILFKIRVLDSNVRNRQSL